MRSAEEGLGATDDELAVGSPDVAFELMHAAHERELAGIRRYIDDLADVHRVRSAERDRCLATVYTGPDVRPERIAQVRAAARGGLRCLVQAGDWHPVTGPHRTVAVGVADAAADPAVRLASAVPLTVYLADDRLGVVVRDAESVVVVHAGLLLRALGELFEACWAKADPQLARRPAGQRDQLAELLLTGLTDQTIGHQLGVGQRTVQRRIAALMADLGAATRFQAGVQAALRPDPDGARPG